MYLRWPERRGERPRPAVAPQLASGAVQAEAALVEAQCDEALPEAVFQLLLYPHAWVRLAAMRWLDLFLERRTTTAAAAAVGTTAPAAAASPSHSVLRSPATCFRVARLLATQLSSPHLGAALADRSVRCLLFLTLLLFEKTQQASGGDAAADEEAEAEGGPSTVDPGDGGASKAPPRAAASAVSASAPRPSDPLLRLFDRMASKGTTGGAIAVAAVLKWVAAAVVRLPAASSPRYLGPVVRLLYRIGTLGDSEASSYPAPVRALAQETDELVQAHVGGDVYICLLGEERNRVAAARLARRQERAVERVVDPLAAAASKAKRQAAKLRQKQRKIDEFRMQKGKASRRRGGGGDGSASGARAAAPEGAAAGGAASHALGGKRKRA